MKKQNLKILIFIVSLFIFPNFTYALEATYPVFLGLPIITANSTIPELIRYFFGIGIYFSGAIALLSLAIAGVQIIIGQANPEGVSNAKDRIKGSLLGIVLLMVSFIIIKSINPVLLTPSITPLTNGPGVFFVKGNNRTTAITASNASDIPPEFVDGDFEYRCPNPTTDPSLLIWIYKNKNLDPSGGADTFEVECEDTFPIPLNGSYKLAIRTPGIYIYKNAGCTGYRSDVITTSQEIPEEFKKRPPIPPNTIFEERCIQIINNPTNKTYYGAILHSEINESGGGECQTPIIYDSSYSLVARLVKQVSIDKLSSITIFNINDNPKTSGDGIVFYSHPYGWDTGAKTGSVLIRSPFDTKYYFAMKPENIIFTKSNLPTEEEKISKNFDKKQGSIKIQGNYIVALYSGTPSTTSSTPDPDGYCQVFRNNVVDLNGTEFLGKGNKIQMVYLIATK